AARTGESKETQNFRLTNRSGNAQSLTITPGSTPAGVIVRATPQTVQLPAGASADIAVEIETANATMAYPADAMLGGEIRITGSATRTISWAFLRTARARMTFDGFATYFVALGPGGARGNPIRDPQSSEVFLEPGKWDFVLDSADAKNGIERLIVKADVDITGDHQLDFRESDASLELIVDGRDETGRSLSARSSENADVRHFVGRRIFWESGSDRFSFFLLDKRKDVRRLLFSPLPARYQLYTFEQLIDFQAAESYTVEHESFQGLTETKTLNAGGSELIEATIRWRETPRAGEPLSVCAYQAMTANLNVSHADCYAGPAPASLSFVHRINNERSPLAHNAMLVRADGAETQALRGRDGRVVVSSQITPPPTAEQVSSGSTLIVSAGPAFPFALPGTRAAQWFRTPPSGFMTAAGSIVAGGAGMEWTTYDASGVQTASGSWRGLEGGQAPPAPRPQSKLIAKRYDLRSGGRTTLGTLEATFGSDSDLDAPTLTSMRVVDAQGKTTDRLNAGETATLQFSVADLDYLRGASSLPTRPEATRAWFRVAGTEAWQPLSVSIAGVESGSLNSLGHVPSGDQYSAPLAAATAMANVRVDLRVEFADPAGNSVRWTHEAALTVGNPADAARRRRSVRN
ncbi:MAG TPA: hypothetical protein VF911_19095, partial [Thermoanaerobaculia bacterium]